MTITLRSTLILLGLALLSSQPAPAQDSPPGRKLAVVVGVGAYRANSGLPSLGDPPGNDAASLSQTLREQGFTVTEMTHAASRLAGQESMAPQITYIRDHIKGMLDYPNLGPDDAVIISLSGHGVQYEYVDDQQKKTPRFYFCPADASISGIKTANDITDTNNLLPLDELYKDLAECKASTKLLVVDACRNDPTEPGVFRAGLASATLPKLPPPTGGTVAFFSCKANQQAVQDKELGQGVFARFLVLGLQGAADQPLATSPPDGIVTFAELSAYVANNTYNHVYEKYKVRQSPELRGDFDLNLPLARIAKNRVPAAFEFLHYTEHPQIHLSDDAELVLLTATSWKDEETDQDDKGFPSVTQAFDLRTGRPVSGRMEHQRATQFNAFSFDGKQVVTCGRDGLAKLWRLGNGTELFQLKHPQDGETIDNVVSRAYFSPDGSRLLTDHRFRELRMWDTRSGLLVAGVRGANNSRARFMGDGKSLFVETYDTGILHLDSSNLLDVTGPYANRGELLLNGEMLVLTEMVVNPTPSRAMRDITDGFKASIFNEFTKTVLLEEEGTIADILPGGNTALVTHSYSNPQRNGQVEMSTYDLTTGRKLHELHKGYIMDAGVSHEILSSEGTQISAIIEQRDRQSGVVINSFALVWDAKSGELRGRIELPKEVTIWDSCFNRFGEWLILHLQNECKIYDIGSGKLIRSIRLIY